MAEGTAFRVLIVDDDPALGQLLSHVITAHGFPAPTVVSTGREAQAAGPVDVILLDHNLPDTTGLDILPTLRGGTGRPSVILITAHGGEELAASALRLGAEDYLIKDASLAQLLPEVLERVRRTRALREALAAAEADLVRAERLAAIGELTVTLHHEINNPLMSATAEVEVLLEGNGLTPAQRESIGSVRSSLVRIAEVVKRAGELQEARSSRYLGHMGMIDLSPQGEAIRAVSQGSAVLWIADEALARVASLLLRHAGFTVEQAADTAALAAGASRLGVSLIVVAAGPGEVLGGFRPKPDRMYTLVALVSGDGAAERAAGADHLIRIPIDPGAFTEEVMRAMEGR